MEGLDLAESSSLSPSAAGVAVDGRDRGIREAEESTIYGCCQSSMSTLYRYAGSDHQRRGQEVLPLFVYLCCWF